MKPIWKGVIIYLITFFLQIILNVAIPHSLQVPNILLVATILGVYLFQEERIMIMTLGLIFATIMDVYSGYFIGIGLCSMLVTELIVLLFMSFFSDDNLLIATVFSAVMNFVYYTCYWIVGRIGGSSYTYLFALKTILIELIIDTILFVILYLILRRHIHVSNRRDWYGR